MTVKMLCRIIRPARRSLGFRVNTTIAIGLLLTAFGRAAEPKFSPDGVAFLKTHCIKCHSGKKPAAELSLTGLTDSATAVKGRKVLEKVLRMLASGEMPPGDEPRPTVASVEAFSALVLATWDHADLTAKPDPGRVTMRRLNRLE